MYRVEAIDVNTSKFIHSDEFKGTDANITTKKIADIAFESYQEFANELKNYVENGIMLNETNTYSKTTKKEQAVLSFMYTWLSNVEKIDGNPEPLKPLLADDFALVLSESNTIDTEVKFENWVKSSAKLVKSSNHFPENLKITELGKNTYQLDVEFIWRGVSVQNVPLQAHAVHKWILENDDSWESLKMRRMEVTYKIPFSPLNKK